MIPEFNTLIPQPPITSYDIKLDEKTFGVPSYRVESTSGVPRAKEKDQSYLVQSHFVEDVPLTTSQMIVTCGDPTCKTTVRTDEKFADSTIEVFNKRHSEDLVEKYWQGEKSLQAEEQDQDQKSELASDITRMDLKQQLSSSAKPVFLLQKSDKTQDAKDHISEEISSSLSQNRKGGNVERPQVVNRKDGATEIEADRETSGEYDEPEARYEDTLSSGKMTSNSWQKIQIRQKPIITPTKSLQKDYQNQSDVQKKQGQPHFKAIVHQNSTSKSVAKRRDTLKGIKEEIWIQDDEAADSDLLSLDCQDALEDTAAVRNSPNSKSSLRAKTMKQAQICISKTPKLQESHELQKSASLRQGLGIRAIPSRNVGSQTFRAQKASPSQTCIHSNYFPGNESPVNQKLEEKQNEKLQSQTIEDRVSKVMDTILAPKKYIMDSRLSKFEQLRRQQNTKKNIKIKANRKIDEKSPLSDVLSISFYQMMQILCPPNESFHGCKLKIVETVFFDSKHGKACEIILTNQEGFLSSIKSEKRLSFLAIQKFFTEVVRNRRKAPPPAWRESIEEEVVIDNNTLVQGQATATQFSDMNFSDKSPPLTSAYMHDLNSIVSRSKVEQTQRDKIGSEFDANRQRSLMATKSSKMNKPSTMSKKSTSSSAKQKKLDQQQALKDLAVFRFAVDPETLPVNTRLELTDYNAPSGQNNQPQQAQEADQQVKEVKNIQSKYEDKGFVKIVNERIFCEMMTERAASRQWRAIECIQACIKAQKGLGKHIPINFKMQLDLNEQKEIKLNLDKKKEYVHAESLGLKYKYQKVGEEYRKELLHDSHMTAISKLELQDVEEIVEQKLKMRRPKDFCLRQVLKMCYYVQKVHQVEILQMNCDFFQDDNGEVWLFHAKDILVRPQIKSQAERDIEEDILKSQHRIQEKRKEAIRIEKFAQKAEREKFKANRAKFIKEPWTQAQGRSLTLGQSQEKKRQQMKRIQKLSKHIDYLNSQERIDMLKKVDGDCQLSYYEMAMQKYAKQFQKHFLNYHLKLSRKCKVINDSSGSETETKSDLIRRDRERLQNLPNQKITKIGPNSSRRSQNDPLEKLDQKSAAQQQNITVEHQFVLSEQQRNSLCSNEIHFDMLEDTPSNKANQKLQQNSIQNNQNFEKSIESNYLHEAPAKFVMSQMKQSKDVSTSFDKQHTTARSHVMSVENSEHSTFIMQPSGTEKSYFNTIRAQQNENILSSLESSNMTQIQNKPVSSNTSRQVDQQNAKSFSMIQNAARIGFPSGIQTIAYGFTSGQELMLMDQQSSQLSAEQVIKEKSASLDGRADTEQTFGGRTGSHSKEMPPVGIHRNFSVQQVNKAGCTRIYLINKGRNINIDNSQMQADATTQGTHTQNFQADYGNQSISIRPSHTALPNQRVRGGSTTNFEKQKHLLMIHQNHQSDFQINGRLGRQTNMATFENSNRLHLQNLNFFNVMDANYPRTHTLKGQKMYEKNLRQQPKIQHYLRSIDRKKDEDEPSFFHWPEPQKVQRTNNFNFQKMRTVTQQRQSSRLRGVKHQQRYGVIEPQNKGMSGRHTIKAKLFSRPDISSKERELLLKRTNIVNKCPPLKRNSQSPSTNKISMSRRRRSVIEVHI